MSSRPQPHWISPTLAAVPNGDIPAYECKFLVSESQSLELEAWLTDRLNRDPHADPERGYTTTSVYFDTDQFDVFRRTPNYIRDKYRARRYGTTQVLHFERKSKQDGRVWKVRSAVTGPTTEPLAVLGLAHWFNIELTDLGLRPVCRVTYDRKAYLGGSETGPVRVTLDRSVMGQPCTTLETLPLTTGTPLVSEGVIVEFKYLATVPVLFKTAIELFRLTPMGVSKYRRCMSRTGLVPEGLADA